MLHRLSKAVRFGDWWAAKIALFVTVALLTVDAYGLSAKLTYDHLGRLLISASALAAFAHLVNDWGDIAADALANKPNQMAKRPSWQRFVLTGGMVALGFGVWIGGDLSWLGWGVLAGIALIQPLYALPPIRLKQRGAWGVAADALHTTVLPLSFVLVVFTRDYRQLADVLTLAIVGWSIGWGVRSILIHQLYDFEADALADIDTFAIRHGQEQTRRVAFFAFGLEVGMLLLIIVSRLPVIPVFAGGTLLVMGVRLLQCRKQLGRHIAPTRQQHPILFADLYSGWWPLLAAIALVMQSARFAPLLLFALPLLWRPQRTYHWLRWTLLDKLYWWGWRRFVKLIRIALGREQRAIRPNLDRAPRTAFVLPDGMGLGGVTMWSLVMARALAARGWPIALVEHVNTRSDREPIDHPNIEIIPHSGQRPAIAKREEIARFQPSYARALPAVLLPNYTVGAYAACAQLSRQYADHMHIIGYAHTDQDYYYDLLTHYEPLIHHFVAVSAEILSKLQARLPERSADMSMRPYGVNVPAQLERRYSQPNEPLRLVYAGRFVEQQKQITRFYPLVKALMRRGVNFELYLFGGGKDEGELRHRLRRLPSAARSRVHVAGRRNHSEMAAIWNSADVCVLVSDYEGTSIAMLEGMAHGCVPVVPAVSGMRDVIAPNSTGFTYPTGDMERMATLIADLDANRHNLADIGGAAHYFVKENFSFEAYVNWFDALVERVRQQPVREWSLDRPILPPDYRPSLGSMLPEAEWTWKHRLPTPLREVGVAGKRVARRVRWSLFEEPL